MELFYSHWTDFQEIWYWSIFRKSVEKIQVSLKSEKNNCYCTCRLCTVMVISLRILLGLRNVSDKICRRNQNIFYARQSFTESRGVYVIMCKNMVESDRSQMTIWHMRITCWMAKTTNTHSEYVTLIAFLQQQWLRKSSSMLRYTLAVSHFYQF